MTVLLLLLCVLCAVYVVLWRWRRRRLLQLAAAAPRFGGALPLIGHAHKFIGDSGHFWKKVKEVSVATQEAGGVMTLWIGPFLYYIITDPDDALYIFNTRLEKSKTQKLASSWLGNSLLLAKVPEWKKLRKLLNPTFSQHMLDGFLELFNTLGKNLIQDFKPYIGNGPFDPRPALTERNLETICQAAMGLSLKDETCVDEEYKRALERFLVIVTKRLTSVWMVPQMIYKWTSLKSQEDVVVEKLHRMSKNVISRRKMERTKITLNKESHRRFKAFLDLLLDMAEDGVFTDEEIREQVDTVLVGGHETTSRAVLHTLILLGSYPAVQEKLYTEVMSVLGSKANVAKEDLSQLVYTEAVLKESMRLLPLTPILSRYIDEDLVLKNYTLPAGSLCMASIWGIHRHPCWGSDAETFRPERWLDPGTLPRSAGAYGAFSLGRRNCIGKPYAYMSMKTSLAHIIRQYSITADYRKLKVTFEMFLKPVSGYNIELESR